MARYGRGTGTANVGHAMRQFLRGGRVPIRVRAHRPRARWLPPLALLATGAALLLYLAWPCATLWSLDRAARNGDADALAALVDLDAVRAAIKTKLNKEAQSAIGPFSDRFIHWLEGGIQALGSNAVDRLVTLPWVQEQLLVHSDRGEGFLGQVSYAFFTAPGGFRLRLGAASGNPVEVRLTLHELAWRVSAVYY